MNARKSVDVALKVFTALTLALAFVLTFTVSDYYIFNRISLTDGEDSFNALFVISQWIKKSGYLLLPLAAYYKRRSCSDIAKYVLPAFIIAGFFTYGNFFEITMLTESASPADKVYASINEFIPKLAVQVLFFTAAGTELISCLLLFARDGFKVRAKSFAYLPCAILAVMPLNIFENFFDINDFDSNHFLWFKNVYHTVFACIPLFICNIGVYVASLSVILRKRILYSISFFVHAAGALTVFFYFGKDEMSNYGIFCSYSILYFCLTHILLFALSVLPSALGHYKFRLKDCIVPLVYYCLVIVVASVASGIVSSASMDFSYDGYTLAEGEWLKPNYAFTQINPLPIPVYEIPFKIWKCEFNLLYLIILYLVYVGLFWIFTGAYYAFHGIRKKVIKPNAEDYKLEVIVSMPEQSAEAAFTDDDFNNRQ